MSMSSDTLKVSWLSICTPLINVKAIFVLERGRRGDERGGRGRGRRNR